MKITTNRTYLKYEMNARLFKLADLHTKNSPANCQNQALQLHFIVDCS